MDWQPFDTAPRNGTKVIVWGEGYKWPEAAYYERYGDAVAKEAGALGYWRYADDLLTDVMDIEEETLTHWAPIIPPGAL